MTWITSTINRRFSTLALLGVAIVLMRCATTPIVGRSDDYPRYEIPIVDLDGHPEMRVVVDREEGQYLGHPSTVLLDDGKTIYCVYPKGHGIGAIVMKRSDDGGKTWSQRLPTPENWATSREVPVLYQVEERSGNKRLLLFSGLYPIRMAISETMGNQWTPLEPIGDFGGVVAMSDMIQVDQGRYMAFFHDDGRFIKGGDRTVRGGPAAESTGIFTLYQAISNDGGRTWQKPEAILARGDVHLCEPGLVQSPNDEATYAMLLRENNRTHNSHITFSHDNGKTWSEPRELPAVLTGDRHQAAYSPDGRLLISFRDRTPEGYDSPTEGDWVAWVGKWADLREAQKGDTSLGGYRIRLGNNHRGADCAYPAIEVLPDGTFVATTYGHWTQGAAPYIITMRFRLSQLDRIAGH